MNGTILAAHDLRRSYTGPAGVDVVLDGASIALYRGQRVGLAGPSGSGKSTLARVLALIDAPDAGQVLVEGRPVAGSGYALAPNLRRRVQLLWQAPRTAVDPRQRLEEVIAEPLMLAERPVRSREIANQVEALAREVGLTPDLLGRRPREVSDGQLQRACLARALAAEPDVLIGDEPTSMLDVSTQAALLAVLAQRVAQGLAVLLISHDTTLLDHWCDVVHHLDELNARLPTAATPHDPAPVR